MTSLEPWQHIRHVTRTARSLNDAWPVLSRTGSSHNGPAKRHSDIEREAREIALAEPGRARCAWCDWVYEGPMGEGIAAHAEHRGRAHRDRVRKPTRRKAGLRLTVEQAELARARRAA